MLASFQNRIYVHTLLRYVRIISQMYNWFSKLNILTLKHSQESANDLLITRNWPRQESPTEAIYLQCKLVTYSVPTCCVMLLDTNTVNVDTNQPSTHNSYTDTQNGVMHLCMCLCRACVCSLTTSHCLLCIFQIIIIILTLYKPQFEGVCVQTK